MRPPSEIANGQLPHSTPASRPTSPEQTLPAASPPTLPASARTRTLSAAFPAASRRTVARMISQLPLASLIRFALPAVSTLPSSLYAAPARAPLDLPQPRPTALAPVLALVPLLPSRLRMHPLAVELPPRLLLLRPRLAVRLLPMAMRVVFLVLRWPLLLLSKFDSCERVQSGIV